MRIPWYNTLKTSGINIIVILTVFFSRVMTSVLCISWRRTHNLLRFGPVPYPGGRGREGGGAPDLIGVPLDLNILCMGHIESKIKNLKGILRVFTPGTKTYVVHRLFI